MHSHCFYFATCLLFLLVCVRGQEDANEYRAFQREISKTTIGPKSLSMCMSGAHCIAGCDCIDRACVNIVKFYDMIKGCQTCNSTEECSGDNGKCLPSIGFCDVCASAAVKAGLDACIPSVDTPTTEIISIGTNADVVIAVGTNSNGNGSGINNNNGDVPAATEEPLSALPPGASVSPEEGDTGSRHIGGNGNKNDNDNVTDSDIAPTDAEIAVPDSVDDGTGTVGVSFEEDEILPLPSVEAEEGACVSVSWLKLHGHIDGVLHNGFHSAIVLCLPLEYNLPCGTPGHLLLRHSTRTMESYEAICSRDNISCLRTRMAVGRLRAAYEWSRVSSRGIQLTPFSLGESQISHVIARAAAGIAAVGYRCGGPELIDEISRVVVKLQQVHRMLRRLGAAVMMGTRR